MISVCMATYNGARHVLAQLQSILPQLSADDEVIVSDDGSTDATREVVRGIGDARIVQIEGPRAGVVRNFEHALRQARGDAVFLCDQDDIWLRRRIRTSSISWWTARRRMARWRLSDAMATALPDWYPSRTTAFTTR